MPEDQLAWYTGDVTNPGDPFNPDNAIGKKLKP
jgi:hypothetical protein